jgi:hypothetical protein
MDFFRALREINGEKCKDYFWGFFGVASWTFIIINLSMMPKSKQGKNIHSIYINVQEFNIWKFYNLKVYMHPRLCMHEPFDLIIINPFKRKC